MWWLKTEGEGRGRKGFEAEEVGEGLGTLVDRMYAQADKHQFKSGVSSEKSLYHSIFLYRECMLS
jgi:hypothetical protein